MSDAVVRRAIRSDARSVARIYNRYIRESTVTFEETPLEVSEVESRFDRSLFWFVIEDEGEARGYAYASPYHRRAAYRHAVEISVYIEYGFEGRGFGTRLYEAVFRELEGREIHVAVGVVALPNPGSVALHERFGMEKVAHFKEVGRKFGRWIDVGHWQKILTFDR